VRLADVQHQEPAVSRLRRALRSGRTPHAYLFVGPEGVGKELAAKALAACLLCQEQSRPPDADACQQCTACRLLAAGTHPDFHLIHRGLHRLHPERTVRQSKGLFLAVDVIRHFLIAPATVTPALGRRRVFVIRDAERMNEEAQNALLKTLEEPPGSAVLILITASAERLLPTIRSRCQQVPFRALPPHFVADELARRLHLPVEEAQALARLSDGRLGVALRWQQIGLLTALAEVANAVGTLSSDAPETFGQRLLEIAGNLAARLKQSADLALEEETEGPPERFSPQSVATDELRDALKLVLLLVAALYRDALLQASGAPQLCLVGGRVELTERLAATSSYQPPEAAIRAVQQAEQMLDRNVSPQLVGEYLAAALLGQLSGT